MKKRLLSFIIVCLVLCTSFVSIIAYNTAYAYTKEQSVYLGGTPIGVVAKCDGVTVLEFIKVLTDKGEKNPGEDAGLQKGDLILKIDSYHIESPEDIAPSLKNSGEKVTLTVKRNNLVFEVSIEPAVDMISNTKKLGLQVKNEIAGVGTLTYVTSNSKRFGGLGHQIYDQGSPNKDIYSKGHIFSCNVVGVIKGESGKAGELRGSFKRQDIPVGKADKNSFSGIFGKAENVLYDDRPLIAVGSKDMVRPGKAYIYTTVKGNSPIRYEIEIVKAIKQNHPADKSMVIRVTDEKLLAQTGGIVQGMSGSPIVQNNRIIGAVTHVFINDATRGYGIYIDWMIDN